MSKKEANEEARKETIKQKKAKACIELSKTEASGESRKEKNKKMHARAQHGNRRGIEKRNEAQRCVLNASLIRESLSYEVSFTR